MTFNARAARARYMGAVRRSFTRAQRLARVGFVGANDLHRTDCQLYQEAVRWPEPGQDAIATGNLESVFVALLEDFADGVTPFPNLHDCLRRPRP
jgi:hypothetical protein